MMNEITITVSGQPKSGKSTVAEQLRQFFKKAHIEVEVQGHPYATYRSWRYQLTARWDAMKRNTKIVIKEKDTQ